MQDANIWEVKERVQRRARKLRRVSVGVFNSLKRRARKIGVTKRMKNEPTNSKQCEETIAATLIASFLAQR